MRPSLRFGKEPPRALGRFLLHLVMRINELALLDVLAERFQLFIDAPIALPLVPRFPLGGALWRHPRLAVRRFRIEVRLAVFLARTGHIHAEQRTEPGSGISVREVRAYLFNQGADRIT